MTLSWKEEANKRRDARASKDEVIREKSSIRKDTKKFCKGKVGKEHILVVKNYFELKEPASKPPYPDRYVLFCSKCGKEIDIFYEFKNEEKPKWLLDYLNKAV